MSMLALRRIGFLAFFLLSLLLVSCGGKGFKVDGRLTNLDGDAVRVVFNGDSGLVDQWIDLDKKGRFSCEGEASEPVLISLLDVRNEPIAVLVAVNGDHLKVKGDCADGVKVKVKGNKVNEEWQLFRDEHAAFYSDPNPSRLDAAIEKFVRENPASLLSTVLLVADYSNYGDRDKLGKMLEGIDKNVRPESLTQALTDAHKGIKKTNLPRLMTLTLANPDGKFEEIRLTDRVALISLWAKPQNDRQSVAQKLRGLADEAGAKVKIIDVLAESDTIRWRQTIAGEEWAHYWAPGGPLEPGIQLLRVNIMPWFAVTDSTGLVTYSGSNIDAAVRAATDCATRHQQ